MTDNGEVVGIQPSREADIPVIERRLQRLQVRHVELPSRLTGRVIGPLPLGIGGFSFAFGLDGEHRDADDGGHECRQARGSRSSGHAVAASQPQKPVDEPRGAGRDRLASQVAAQVGFELRGARVPPPAILLQAFGHDCGHITAELGIHGGERSRFRVVHDAGRFIHRPLRDVVGRLSGEQFVEHHTEGIDIGPHVDLIHLAVELLRAHVLQRADELAHVGEHRRASHVGVGATGHAEVDHLRMPCGVDENIAGLEIAMDHALLMAVADCLAGLTKESDAVAHAEPARRGELRDRLSFLDIFHHEVGHGSAGKRLHPDGIDAGDPGVCQPAENLRLVLEPASGGGREHAGADHLHGHGPTGHSLQTLVHAAHAAFADESHDRHVAKPCARLEIRTGWRRAGQEFRQPRDMQTGIERFHGPAMIPVTTTACP